MFARFLIAAGATTVALTTVQVRLVLQAYCCYWFNYSKISLTACH